MPSIEEDVSEIGRQLEKMVAGKKEMDDAMELIQRLATLPVTLEILTKTRIGITINALRKKSEDEVLLKRSKTLIKSWKSIVEVTKGGAQINSRPRSSKSADDSSPSNCSGNGGDNGNGGNDKGNIQTTSYAAATDRSNGTVRGDGEMSEIRSKAVEMLTNALRSADLPHGTVSDPEELSNVIEKALFKAHGGDTGDKYRAALRSRVFNLKKNAALRENVLTGAVTPDKFSIMSVQEMASDEMKQQREEFTKQAILEHQLAQEDGQPTDMFKCGKCKSKNCTYTQLQTRSSDEPMTTFVYCRTCGNRWKFC